MHSGRASARKSKLAPKPQAKGTKRPSKTRTKPIKITKISARSSSTTPEQLSSQDGFDWAKGGEVSPDVDLEKIEAFKHSFLQKEMAMLSDPWRQTAFDKQINDDKSDDSPIEEGKKKGIELQSVPFEPLHQLISGTQRLTRKQTRELLEFSATSNIVNDLIKKVPPQYATCRGCGIGLQCEAEHSPGFIPAPNLQSYLLRLDIQLRAAKQDLRIRSGGGKGQGTAVAALHASLKSSLGQLQRESEARTGKLGRFNEEHLNKMGLDKNLKPLHVDPVIDPETGLLVFPEHPEDNPVLMNLDHLNKDEIKVMKKELNRLLNDPAASAGQINQLQQRITDLEEKKPNLQAEAKKINKNEVLDKRDIDLLTKAAKMAARPAKCQRCHRIGSKQYNAADANVGQSVPAEDFVKLLMNEFHGPNAKPSIIVQVIDVLDFHGSIIRDLPKLTGPRNPIILAVNKCDILPRDVSPLQVKQWAKKEAEKYGMHVHSVFPISAGTGAGVDELVEKALILARGNNDPTAPKNRNIYVMGTTNVGKSSLINQLLQKGVCGTGMPNDVTHIKPKVKKGGNGEEDGFEEFHLDPNEAQFMDTQPLDDEMEDEMINAKKAQRAAKKNNNNKNGQNGQNDEGMDFNNPDSIAKVLMSTKRDRDRPDVNPVIADIDVAGINKQALQAVLPDQYLLQHQREIQLKEAVSTTSPIPGTTLGIVSFPVLEKKRGGKSLQIKDTPGVLNSWQLTSQLNYPELKRVLPTKKITPLTYRVQPGQSIFLGAMARVDMIAGKPFHITNFVSNAVSVHVAAAHRANEDYLRQQIGVNLIPPFDPEQEADVAMMQKDEQNKPKWQQNQRNGQNRAKMAENRCDQLNIYSNLSNASQEESDALEALQHLSRLEAQLANERSKKRIYNEIKSRKNSKNSKNGQNSFENGQDDDFDPDGDEIALDHGDDFDDDIEVDKSIAFGAKNVIESIPDPKNGADDLAHRRKALRDQISVALGKLAPVVTPRTSNPSRVFMDQQGRIVVQLVGEGFNTSSHDIVIAGLGWITVTGSGPCTLRISVAGEKAQLRDFEMAALEEFHHYREDSSEIIMESNVEPHLDSPARRRRGPELPTRVRKLISRVIVRDPLVATLGRTGTKWTGLPELVKKSFTPAMAQQRAQIMKRNELLALHRKNPELHPHPDELQSRIHAHPEEEAYQYDMQHPFAGDENFENFDQKELLNRNPLTHSTKLKALHDFEQELLHERSKKQDEITKKHKVANPYGFDDFETEAEDDMLGASQSKLDQTIDFLAAAGQRPKDDTQRGPFDAVPHPPIKHHSELDVEFQKAKTKAKAEEKELLDEWSFIQEFRQKHLLDQSSSALGVDINAPDQDGTDRAAGAAKGFVDGVKGQVDAQLAKLKEELVAARPNKGKLQELLAQHTLADGSLDPVFLKKGAKAKMEVDPLDEDFEDSYDGSELESYEMSGDDGDYDQDDRDDQNGQKSDKNNNTGQNSKKMKIQEKTHSKKHADSSEDGEYGDDDDEELMDMDQIYDGMSSDSEEGLENGENGQNIQKSSKSRSKKLTHEHEDGSDGEVDFSDDFGSDFDDMDDSDGGSGPDLTDDVELLTNLEDMPTFEEMAEISDFDGVDYNDLRKKGLLEVHLAKENDKIQKRPVPTGPSGKRETGGRRAREAMGMISQNKFADVKKAQIAKEAKLLQSYIKKANRAAQFEENRALAAAQSALKTTKGNRGIVPKGESNALTAGKQWDNQSYKFEAQNQAKAEKKAKAAQKNAKYGPNSDAEDSAAEDFNDARSQRKSRGKSQANTQARAYEDDSDAEIGGFGQQKGGRNMVGRKKSEDFMMEYPGGEVSYDFEERAAAGQAPKKSTFPGERAGTAPRQQNSQNSQNSQYSQNVFKQNKRQDSFDMASDEGYSTDDDSMPSAPRARHNDRFAGSNFGQAKPAGGFGGGFGGDRSPRRDFGSDRPPRRDFDNDRPPRRDFGGDRQSRDFGDRPPRRDFDNDRPPRRDFGGDRPPRRDFGGDRPPRRDFGGDRPPRRDFGGDRQGQGRDFGGDRPPRRDFGDRPPRRDFGDDNRPPRRDFGGSKPGGFGGRNGGGRRGFSTALNSYFHFNTEGVKM